MGKEVTDPAELIRVLRAENQQLKAENHLLKEKVDLLIRRIFGVKSEQLDPAQLELLLTQTGTPLGKGVASAEAEALPLLKALKAVSRKDREPCPRRERWPEDLPVLEEILEPEEVQARPEAFRCIGQEVSETLDYEPARFLRRRLIRRKYVEREEAEEPPVIAPLPERLQQRCLAAPGLLALLIVSKFCDHVPLYRQEQIYWNRHQVWLPRASQARWLGLCAEWLSPIYRQIKAELMSGAYLQVDETPIKYLDPGNGKAAQGYLWVASQPKGDMIFDWHTSRAARCLPKLIPPEFAGTLQCDGYTAYDRFASLRAQTGNALTLAGCSRPCAARLL